jgi:hypothetical protein
MLSEAKVNFMRSLSIISKFIYNYLSHKMCLKQMLM